MEPRVEEPRQGEYAGDVSPDLLGGTQSANRGGRRTTKYQHQLLDLLLVCRTFYRHLLPKLWASPLLLTPSSIQAFTSLALNPPISGPATRTAPLDPSSPLSRYNPSRRLHLRPSSKPGSSTSPPSSPTARAFPPSHWA